jgi:hypothetical protein
MEELAPWGNNEFWKSEPIPTRKHREAKLYKAAGANQRRIKACSHEATTSCLAQTILTKHI